ncbi:MAG TPA: Zn-ribbon domain-containing OB-fold protein [Streptosporangiaceae bacterium]
MNLPTPPPHPDADTREFWAGCAQGTLLLTRCAACAAVRWYPRSRCPECGGAEADSFPARGRGTVYSFTIVRRAGGEFAAAVPYVVAYVELNEGPRILTNIIGCDPEEVRIGQPVTLKFVTAAGGHSLYRFAPDRPAQISALSGSMTRHGYAEAPPDALADPQSGSSPEQRVGQIL